MSTTHTNPTRYDVRRDLVPPTPTPPPNSLFYSQLTGSANNLMMAHLQGRNMLYIK